MGTKDRRQGSKGARPREGAPPDTEVDGAPATGLTGRSREEGERTLVHVGAGEAPVEIEGVRRFRLTVVEGPGAGTVRESKEDRVSIGSHALNDLVLDDATVSRFHCEIRMDAEGAHVVDLRSRNGTIVDGVVIKEAMLRSGSTLRLGRVVVRFDYGAERNRPPVSSRTRFGALTGTSLPMRAVFAVLERAAPTETTVLLEGETGTGKGVAAASLHRESTRREGPLVVVDCGAIPANLLESELFGHEKGAFTGAEARRVGAFEEASGGSIFLDEIGELPLDLQPKLLRALESKEIRRVGSNRMIPVDVRVIAATNRDLRAEVNAGRFRPDLYYRLAVVKLRLPALRERPEDVPDLVNEFIRALGIGDETAERLRGPDFIAELQRHSWPGNVRELRNHLERCVVFQDVGPLPEPDHTAGGTVPFAEARRRAIEQWERSYVDALLRQFQGRVTPAAAAAGVDRAYLYKLIRRHGIK